MSADSFRYMSKGRGRGILSMTEYVPCRRPYCLASLSTRDRSTNNSCSTDNEGPPASLKVAVVRHSYVAQPGSPGGFKELSVRKDVYLSVICEHPDNEHWWEVRTESGEQGYVPASYLTVKEDTALPWLEHKVLENAEEERRTRVQRLEQERAALDCRGFGPPPKNFCQAVNAIKKQSSEDNYCGICKKKFNGPIPYKMHMSSKAHKEEQEALLLYENS